MMRFAIVESATGRIVQMAMADSTGPISSMLTAGQVAIEAPDRSMDDSTHYASGARLLPFPPRPPHRTWNWASKAWV